MNKLKEWREKADDLDIEYIDLLISKLKDPKRKYNSIIKEVEKILSETQKHFETIERQKILDEILKAEEEVKWKYPNSLVYATVTMHPSFRDYSLYAPEYDMTNW